jgi:hypothetical protein
MISWLGESADYLASLGPLVLAIAGTIVSIIAIGGPKKWLLAAVFSSIGLVSFIATIASLQSGKLAKIERDKLQRRIDAGVTGGDNFCFFEAIIQNPKNFEAPVQLRIVNNGDGPIKSLRYFISPYSVRGDAANLGYWSLMKRAAPIEICPIGSHSFGVILKPGAYRIKFTPLLATRENSGWHQILKIEQSFDRLVAVTDVNLNNGKKYRSPRPPNYRDW